MDAFELIQADLARGQNNRVAVLTALGLGTLVLPMALGLSWRDSWNGVMTNTDFVLHLGAALSLAAAFFCTVGFSSARTRVMAMIFALLSLGLATESLLFPGALRTTYPNFAVFLHESEICFYKGIAGAIVTSVWALFCVFRFATLPTRRVRILLSLGVGVSSAVMLGFHCDSSSVPHVLAGHWLPGLLSGLVIFYAQETLMWIAVERRIPGLSEKFQNPRKIVR